ncbi:LmbE family protein [Mycolicibacterium litorale]|nr:LmbE family protein [Mycolicibacterium litorale]
MNATTASNAARFAEVPIRTGGTPAAQWLQWRPDFPPLPLDRCRGLVVVAPHPDDETLGFGATAGTAAALGIDVHVVVATDGGAAHPGLAAPQRTQLEATRRHESRCAAEVLKLSAPTFLRLADGGLVGEEARLADILTGILSARAPGTWCAATWRGDGHPDHEAVGRSAAVAAARTGAVLLEYPVWMWHWAQPGDPAVPWHSAARAVLDPVAVERKREAVAVYRSQTEPDGGGRQPVLPPAVLSRLESVGEVVFW